MFETFNDDLTYLPKKKFAIKYTLPFVVGLFCALTLSQLISQLFSINQLNKVSGQIEDIRTKLDYWKHNRGSFHDSPVYALFITLNNQQVFKEENVQYMQELDETLHPNDQITIYYPTLTYKMISFGFAGNISQLELGTKTVLSFDQEKKDRLFLIYSFAICAGLFYCLLFNLRKYAI